MSALALSPTFTNSRRPLSVTSLPNQSYVISVAALQTHYAVAASAPSNAIHLYDKADCKTIVRTLPAHEEGVNFMRAVENLVGSRDTLLSCGKDGSVKAWDERTGIIGVQMLVAGRRTSLLSCDASSDGFMVAAGTILQGDDASILYWDPRNPVAPLSRHSSTHSDDVTAVHFDRVGTSEVLLSASTDGLLCTSNPLEMDEDEAGINVGNWGCSVSRAGWIRGDGGSGGPRVWASSDMETVSVWSDELDVLQDVERDRLVHADPDQPWVTDYIVDCHSSRNGSFHLFAGSNEGDFSMISPPTAFGADSRWTLEQSFSTGHSEVVRCVLWDEASGLVLSGGEDSKLLIWSCPSRNAAGSQGDESMDVDSPRKRLIINGSDTGYKRVRTL